MPRRDPIDAHSSSRNGFPFSMKTETTCPEGDRLSTSFSLPYPQNRSFLRIRNT